MAGHYDPFLVFISLLISILSSWAALELSGRVALKRSSTGRLVWLCCGATAMGIGIWSMHYVGMLAYRTDMPVLYDWPTVLLSMLAAIVASGCALFLVSRDTLSWMSISLGSLFMGGGIASMHYIGMAAMRMPAQITYSWPLVLLSILSAVIISMAALRLTFDSRHLVGMFSIRKVASALLMGFAIPVMHYLGMAAARWSDGPGNFTPNDLKHAVEISEFSTLGIVLVACLVTALAVASAGIERHLLRYKRRNNVLNTHNKRLQGAFRAGGVGIYECDLITGMLQMDPRIRMMYEFPMDDIPISRDEWKKRIHSEDLPRVNRNFTESILGNEKYESDFRVLLSDGIVRHYRTIGSILREEDGKATRMVGMTWDITAEYMREREIADQAESFRMTLEAIGDAVITVDENKNIIYLNPVASSLTGWSPAEAVKQPLGKIFVVEDEHGDTKINPVDRCKESGGTLLAEDGVLRSRTGERFNIKKHVALMDNGRAAVLTFQDITKARRMERVLQHAATHDSLTGLLNRAAFEKRLEALWEDNRYSGRCHALCVVDLDRFKIINDTSGHMAGDALLREISRVLQHNIKKTDTVARMGGDEFMLLLADTPLQEAQEFATRLLKHISEIRFPWKGKTYDITASLGMVSLDCFSPKPEVLISQADVATFTAKRGGRDRVAVYEEQEGNSSVDHQEMEIVANLRKAIESDWFELHAQPIVPTLSTKRPNYFELLIRMRNERGELISPALFIPAAERYGLMTIVDRWVIRHALALYSPVCKRDCGLRFAINLSADSLSDPELWPFVQEQFLATGVPPSCITFEITETGAIQNLATAKSFMQQARTMGSRIALDDFGTGLSSLTYLKQFPLDVLKIDGSFVRKLLENPLDQTIVRSIAEVARTMNAVTVAECVEDQATIELLKELGADYVQGWATGRPVPLWKVLEEANVTALSKQNGQSTMLAA